MLACILIVNADLFLPHLVDCTFFRQQFCEVEEKLFLIRIAEDVNTRTSVIVFKVSNRL
jgi:hypothetical protein